MSSIRSVTHNDLTISQIVDSLTKNKLSLVSGISFDDATRLIRQLVNELGLSTSSDHHFNHMGDPFRISVNDVFHEVSKYGGRSIFFHNENAYSQNMPELTCLYCEKNSEFGGENVFLSNSSISRGQDSLRHRLRELYVRKRLHYVSHDEVNRQMADIPNFRERGITTIEEYVQYLGQFTQFLSVEMTSTQLEVTHKISLYAHSEIDGKSYIQVPGDGNCRVTYHVPEFCERMGIFYNPMFQYITDEASHISRTSETAYFTDKECRCPIDLNQVLFEMVLLWSYTQAVPVKLYNHSLIIFNNKSWMHSVNAPGLAREVYVSYAYK